MREEGSKPTLRRGHGLRAFPIRLQGLTACALATRAVTTPPSYTRGIRFPATDILRCFILRCMDTPVRLWKALRAENNTTCVLYCQKDLFSYSLTLYKRFACFVRQGNTVNLYKKTASAEAVNLFILLVACYIVFKAKPLVNRKFSAWCINLRYIMSGKRVKQPSARKLPNFTNEFTINVHGIKTFCKLFIS